MYLAGFVVGTFKEGRMNFTGPFCTIDRAREEFERVSPDGKDTQIYQLVGAVDRPKFY